jgi:prepilin-type N-terminal cleavage/methylation domain-containing protein
VLPDGKQTERGFTLPELLVAMLLVVLIFTSMVSALNYVLPRWSVRKASIDISTALRAARAKAVIDQTEIIVPFDIDRRLYVLVSETAPGGVIVEHSWLGTRRLAKLPDGVCFSRPDEGKSITFSPPGAPDEEAAVFDSSGILQSSVKPGDVHLGVPAKGLFRRVRVNLAGNVTIERWNGSEWDEND